jgi:hypothetical protein
MENLITWLEKQIEGCEDLGGMGKEKWAFIQTLKKVRKEQLTLPVVRLSLFNEVYDKFVKCEDDDEFTQYLNKNTNEA